MGCITKTLGRLLFVTIILSSAYLHLSKPQNYTEDLSSNYAQFVKLVNEHVTPGVIPPAEVVFYFLIKRLTGPCGVRFWECSKDWLSYWLYSEIVGEDFSSSSTCWFLELLTTKIFAQLFNGMLKDNLRYAFLINLSFPDTFSSSELLLLWCPAQKNHGTIRAQPNLRL